MYGDPHMLTLDGLFYTFNGIGEFVFIKSEIINVQVRTIQAQVC